MREVVAELKGHRFWDKRVTIRDSHERCLYSEYRIRKGLE